MKTSKLKPILILAFFAFTFFLHPASIFGQFTCATATTINDGQCLTGQTMGGGFSGGFAGCNGGSQPVHFYNFTAPGNGDCVQFNITNPSVNATWEIMIYTLGCGAYVSGTGGCIENVVAGNPFSVSSQDFNGVQALTPGTSYTLILSGNNGGTYDICFTSPGTQAASNECSGPINVGATSNFYNGGDCQFSGSFDDGSTTDPAANLLCAGSLENTQWLTFTASSAGNITLTGSNISCTGGGCGFQFGIFSAGVGGSCCGGLTHLGCYGDKVCAGGQSTAGPTNPAGRITWSGTSGAGFTALITGVTAGEVFCFVMDGNADADCRYTLTATGILPIGIANLEGFQKDEVVNVSWTTPTEVNSAYFEVLRSSTGDDFEIVATIPAAGNSSDLRGYSFVDNNPVTGKNFYRVRQVDVSGSMLNSQIIVVGFDYKDITVGLGNNEIRLFMGPSVLDRAPLTIRLMNLAGEVVKQETINSPSFEYSIATGDLRPGVFMVSVSGDHFNYYKKIVVQ